MNLDMVTNMREFTAADAGDIRKHGDEFRKRSTIHAIPVPAGTRVKTDEGWTELEEPGYVATDGKGVWPIKLSFMQQNYDLVHARPHPIELPLVGPRDP